MGEHDISKQTTQNYASYLIIHLMTSEVILSIAIYQWHLLNTSSFFIANILILLTFTLSIVTPESWHNFDKKKGNTLCRTRKPYYNQCLYQPVGKSREVLHFNLISSHNSEELKITSLYYKILSVGEVAKNISVEPQSKSKSEDWKQLSVFFCFAAAQEEVEHAQQSKAGFTHEIALRI